MIYVRYFLFADLALLSVLFAVDAYFPRQQGRDRTEIDKSTIRISSALKPPEEVVIDTTLPTVVPANETRSVDGALPVSNINSSLQAFAKISPSQKPKVASMPRKSPPRRAIVKQMLHREVSVAEQPLPNFFEGRIR